MKVFIRFYITLLASLFCSASISYSQNTTALTGTVTDSDSQAWINAGWIATIQIPGGGGQAHYLSGGVVPRTFSGTLSSSGAFSAATVGNTAQIVPTGVTWQYCFYSVTSAPPSCFTQATQGSTFNMGTYASSRVIAPRIESGEMKYAYNVTEIEGMKNGNGYVNIVSLTQFTWENNAWIAVGSGSGVITGLIQAGANITITGSGTSGSPYVISSTGGSGSGNPIILPSTLTLASFGDSLCNTPTLTTSQNLVNVMSTLPSFNASPATPQNQCVSGNTLSGMVSDYTATGHAISPVVTGKPGIALISIYGNDIGTIQSGGLPAYETSYAAFLTTLQTDGWKVMFLEQWPQTGRQNSDLYRIQFNEYNRESTQVNYYLSTVGRMNTPSNTIMYQSDGLHETVLGAYEISRIAEQAVLSGGTSFSYGNTVFENIQIQPQNVVNSGDASQQTANFSPSGVSGSHYYNSGYQSEGLLGFFNQSWSYAPFQNHFGFQAGSAASGGDMMFWQNPTASGQTDHVFLDDSGTIQFVFGHFNSSSFLPNQNFIDTKGNRLNFCSGTSCGSFWDGGSSWTFPTANISTGNITTLNANSILGSGSTPSWFINPPTSAMGFRADPGYQMNVGTANQSGACVNIGQWSTAASPSFTTWLPICGPISLPSAGTTATITPVTGVSTSCLTATCTSLAGSFSVNVTGVITVGPFIALTWSATPTTNICLTSLMATGTGAIFDVAHDVATTTGFNMTVTSNPLNPGVFQVDYRCGPN